MALVATVLLAVLAASIVLVIATQAINASHNESSRSDASQASAAAANAAQAFESQLQQNPYFFFSSVFSTTVNGQTYAERARVCIPTSSTIQPGSAWSVSSCGVTWNYTKASSSPTAWLQLTPPSLTNPSLQVQILATVGSTSEGLSLTFRMQGTEGYSLLSSGSIDLNTLPSQGPQAATGCPPACSSVSGSIYSGGTITLPTSSLVSLSNAQLLAELGFAASPSDPTSRYYAQSTQLGSTPPIWNIRNIVSDVITTQSLRSSLDRMSTVACPGTTPWYTATTALASSLCLQAGSTVVTSASTAATIPSNVTAYLLVFNGTAKTVTVWYTIKSINPDAACATSSCDLVTQGTTDATSTSSPGQRSFWTASGSTQLGTIPLPQSGIIATDKDVFLGTCSTSGNDTPYLVANSSCPVLSGNDPGMLVGQNITVLAGSQSNPANAWLSSSIETSPGVSFGVVASGQLIIPYWAHAPGTSSSTNQVLQGAYTAMGLGVDPSVASPITSYPAFINTTNANNVAAELDLTGSLASPDMNLSFPLFGAVVLAPQSQLISSPPPYFSDIDGRWSLASSSVLTASQVCGSGSTTCPNY